MNFVLGLILGGVVGVLLERVLGQPLDKFVIGPIQAARTRRALLRADRAVQVTNETTIVAGSALFVHQFVASGLARENLSARVERSTRDIRERFQSSVLAEQSLDPDELLRSIAKWRTVLADDPRQWNGSSLALAHIDLTREPSSEQAKLSLSFREADYSTLRAVDEAWTRLPLSVRRSLDGDVLREVDPVLSNGFGLNCTLETADGLTLITRRSRLTHGWHGHWHIAFNEGLSTMDRRPGDKVDLFGAFARGLHEELGIDADQIRQFDDRLVIHTLFLDVDRYQWGLLAHLDLRDTAITSTAIRMSRNLGAAHDDWEAAEIRFLPFTESARAVIDEVRTGTNWVSHGLLNLALSAVHRHPSDAEVIRSAIADAGVDRRC